MPKQYDLIAIGAGVAGGAAARAARSKGLKVAIIESHEYGGTCPLRGCNPKKVLLAAAETVARARAMHGKGVSGELSIDWAELQEFKATFLSEMPDRIESSYVKRGIDTYHARARFTGPNSIDAGGQELTARHIFLGPGSWPAPLGIPGEEMVTLSDAFLDLADLPRRIVFIGGGYISFEFAHLTARAGSETVILHRSAQVLKGYEPELAQVIVEASREAGIDVRTDMPVTAVQRRGNDLVVLAGKNGDQSFACDMVVHGAGRAPNLEGLDLATGNVAVDKGGIVVNEFMQSTSNPAVYAGGDAARTPFALTPSSNHEGTVAAQNILEGNTLPVNQAGIPRVVFSIPPLAAIGPSETEARQLGLDVQVHSGTMADWLPWERLGEDHAAFKILTAPDGRIVAAHLAGHHAEELSNLFAMAVRLGLTVDEVQKTVWAYPTSGYYIQYMLPHK